MTELTSEQNYKIWLPKTYIWGWLFNAALPAIITLYISIMDSLEPDLADIHFNLLIYLLHPMYILSIIFFSAYIILLIVNVIKYSKLASKSHELLSLSASYRDYIIKKNMRVLILTFLFAILTTLNSNWGVWKDVLNHFDSVLLYGLPALTPILSFAYWLILSIIWNIIPYEKEEK